MDLGGQVCHPPLDSLLVCQLRPEEHTLVGLLDEELDGATRHADRPSGHLQSSSGQPSLHWSETFSDLTHQVLSWDTAVLEGNFERELAADHLDVSRDSHARGARIDEESRDAAIAAVARVSLCHDDDVIHQISSRDPNLRAIQDPAVPLLYGLHRHSPWVRPGPGFRDADGGDGFAAGVGKHVALSLLLVACRHHHVQIRRIGGESEGDDGATELLV
mmetsp:Transcript_37056/g.56049  ORF Transcript_37056/g.56049 Transcript_37056/m.56049 type:complete len:218 (+) Transcript_37056:789-1442(+)